MDLVGTASGPLVDIMVVLLGSTVVTVPFLERHSSKSLTTIQDSTPKNDTH